MTAPQVVIDANGAQYEIAGLLGRGGQGSVYEVKGGRRAVKILNAGGRTQRELLRNRLTQVRRLPLQGLDLARPLELLRPPQVGYVMELVTGMIPLSKLTAPGRGIALSPAWYTDTGGLRHRLRVLARAAQILAELHGKGLAYSDPSPSNIFASADPDFGEVRLIDTDNLVYESGPSASRGTYTPGYGAPELVQGKSGVTTLTDAFAFSVIAFHVLAIAHPFVGTQVHEGEPEAEEQAFMGLLPWIDDENDDSNRSHLGVPRSLVLSKRLIDTFQTAFGTGRTSPVLRPGVSEWAERLHTAADSTIECPDCAGTFYRNCKKCPWCAAPAPEFSRLVFQLWDPTGEEGGRLVSKPGSNREQADILDLAVVTEANRFTITGRLAFGSTGAKANKGILEVFRKNGALEVRSLDGQEYALKSDSLSSALTVTDQPRTIPESSRSKDWRLHFGAPDERHRVLRFDNGRGKRA